MVTVYASALYRQTAQASSSLDDFVARVRYTEGDDALEDALDVYLDVFPERRSEVDAVRAGFAPARSSYTYEPVITPLIRPRTESSDSAELKAKSAPSATVAGSLRRAWLAFNQPPFRIVALITYIVAFFVVINVLWIGGKKLVYWEEQKRLDELVATMRSADYQLMRHRRVLADLETERVTMKDRLDGMSFEADLAPRGSTQRAALIGSFNTLVETYNAHLVKQKASVREFNAIVESYNKYVDESNALAKKIGGTSLLVPVPGRRGHHSHVQ